MLCKRVAALLPVVVVPVLLLGQSPQLVDIGTHTLDVLRVGTGTPAIVFEAGLGDDGLDDWKKVWPAVARMASVVSHPRSGNGRSQLGPGDRSVRPCATELRGVARDARRVVPPLQQRDSHRDHEERARYPGPGARSRGAGDPLRAGPGARTVIYSP